MIARKKEFIFILDKHRFLTMLAIMLMIPNTILEEVSGNLGTVLDEFELNGKVHRSGETSEYWAVGHMRDGLIVIHYGNWKTGRSFRHISKDGHKTNKVNKKILKELQEKTDAAKEEQYRKCRKRANEVWGSLEFSEGTHPYLEKKGIVTNHGAKVNELGLLIVPVSNAKGIVGLQFIGKDGNKYFATGTEVKGSCFLLGDLTGIPGEIYFCEGMATACSIYTALSGQRPVVACFNAGNIESNLRYYKHNYPDSNLIVCADNDQFTVINGTPVNVGVEKATTAAQKFDAELRIPEFDDLDTKPTDFNDLHQLKGLDSVKEQLNKAASVSKEGGFSYWDDSSGRPKLIRQYTALQAHYNGKFKYKNFSEIRRIMIWNGTHYITTNEIGIKCFAEDNFLQPVKELEAKEFLNLVKRRNEADVDFLHSGMDRKLNLKTGVLDVQSEELSAHDPKVGFRYVLPYEYRPEEKDCPTWDLLLKNLTCNRKELQDIIEEFMAYTIFGMSYKEMQYILILSGSGANGKSTLINCISAMIGEENHKSVPISTLNNDQFALANLDEKLANFGEEEPVSCFKETGNLKRITGGTTLTARNPYESSFDFVNKAKIIITYNEMPYLGDTSPGMLRRLVVVPFDLDFTANPEKKIADVLPKIRGELPAILNRIVEKYQKIKKSKELTKSDLVSYEINKMVRDSDPFFEWFEDYVEITKNAGAKVAVSTAYESYQQVMELGKNEAHKISEKGFKKKMRRMVKKGVQEKVVFINGKSVRGYINIKIRSEIADINSIDKF